MVERLDAPEGDIAGASGTRQSGDADAAVEDTDDEDGGPVAGPIAIALDVTEQQGASSDNPVP